MSQPDPVHTIEGDVLLGQSRKIFRQEYFRSYAWRMTGNERYAESFPETVADSVNYSWLKKKNNWNAVCNTEMAFGALATWEDNPDLCSG